MAVSAPSPAGAAVVSAALEYEEAGKIVTVGEVQPLQDSVDSANTVTAAYLQGVKREDVDGIIAYYDLYGQGVYNAICENDNFNGKNGDMFRF